MEGGMGQERVAMSVQWYLRERGEVRGPYRQEELLAMKAQGTLNRFHRVSQDRKTWLPLGEIDHQETTAAPPPVFAA